MTSKERRQKNEESNVRLMYIRSKTIVDALDVVNKVRYSRLISLNTITEEKYLKGISLLSEYY